MPDLARCHHRAFDRAAEGDEIAETLRRHFEADARRVNERVERAAEREVVAHVADTGHLNAVVEGYDERRHVLERDAPHARAFKPRPRGHASRRRVEPNDRTLADKTDLERDGHQGDYAVATHRAPALVVHEKDAGVAVGCDGLGRYRSIHVRVPSRLEHQAASYAVEPLARETPLFEDRRPGDRVEAAGDHPERLARGVGLHGEDPPPGRRRAPGRGSVGRKGHGRADDTIPGPISPIWRSAPAPY